MTEKQLGFALGRVTLVVTVICAILTMTSCTAAVVMDVFK